MTDNLSLGGDGQANHTLAVLRGSSTQGPLGPIVELVPGLALHADPAMNLTGTWRTPEARLLELDARPGSDGGSWFGLHLALPATDLRDIGVLGFAARVSAPEILVVRACLRSGTDSGFEDCFFDKHLLFRSEEASHVDALAVGKRDLLPMQAQWRELILFLPTSAFRLSLIDLRVFAV